MSLRRLALAALLLAACGGATAREQVPAEERLYRYEAELLRDCDDPEVLDAIVKRFDRTEAKYWASDLRIVGFSNVRVTHFRENGLDLVPRRYCRATVMLNNRRSSPLYFVLTQDGGFAGRGFGVQYCVMAYDRQWAYAPECKMARP